MNSGVDERVKDAFGAIRAEQGLKDRTKEFLARKTRHYRGGNAMTHGRVLAAAACCLVLLAGFGGYRVYFTPVSVISIDINPSIELGINRFDRVVSVKGYNDDGERLAAAPNVRFLGYTEAVERILEEEGIAGYLAQDGLMSIIVVEADEEQGRRMLTNLQSCVSEHENVHCHSADTKAVGNAHDEGLSYGKYWAFLRLRELDPDITAEEVQGMTMREIADLFYLLQPDGAGDIWHDGGEDRHDGGEDRHGGEGWHESGEDRHGVEGWHDGVEGWHDGVEDWHDGVEGSHDGVEDWHDGVEGSHDGGEGWHDGAVDGQPNVPEETGSEVPPDEEINDNPYGDERHENEHGNEHGHGHGHGKE